MQFFSYRISQNTEIIFYHEGDEYSGEAALYGIPSPAKL